MNMPFLADETAAPTTPDEVDLASASSMDASDPPAFGGVTGAGAPDAGGEGRTERIRKRAYELWLAAGSPAGADQDFWFQAEKEVGGPSDEESPGT